MKTKIYTLLLVLFANSLLSQNPRIVKDIHLGANHSIPKYLTAFNGKLYFSAYDADYGNEIWVSDGTANGTSLLKDIRVAEFDFQETNSNPTHLTVLNNKLYFFANDGTGLALWETDGTTSGTRVAVKKDENEINLTSFRYMVEFNNNLYFTANNGAGSELFVSDGTENGTKMLKDINLEPLEGSQPKNFIEYKSNLYFTASDRTNGRELWVTNGTESGTKLLKDISIGSYGSSPDHFEIFNDKLYFSATDGNQLSNNGRELWVTEGNESNTVLVKNISSGSQGSYPTYLKTLNDKMYFVASNDNNDAELWMTDGTSQGTQLFKNLNGNSLSSNIKHLTFYNNKLYFQAAVNFNEGLELWETDGSLDGTKLTEDINNGESSSDPKNFTVFNQKLYFTAKNQNNGIELFVYSDNSLSTYIPDDNFEQALIDLGKDDVLDDYVTTTNINDIETLEIPNKEIEDLTGIESFTALTSLNINNNLISSLDISNNTKLYNLSANNNSISSFEVINNYKLYGLSLKNNGLTSLKLTGIFDLADVNVAENNLTTLNLNAARSLIGITANDNNLSILKLKTGNSNAIQVFDTRNNSELTCIEIDDLDHANSQLTNKDAHTNFSLGCSYNGEIYVPDANFERALIALELDDLVDEKVLKVNIENIEKLEVNDWNISDLTGIEGFTSLKELNVNNNNLATLRTNQNTGLQILKAKNNNLTEIITSNNLQLQTVDVSYNNFSTLSLSNSSTLQKLNCSNNENLTELILQNNRNIKELTANETNLATLDISNNTRLVSLSLKENSLTNLNLTTSRNLQYLDISNNNLSELNLINTVDLTNFIANHNEFTTLNLTTAPNLIHFSATDNNLTTIDLRNGNSSNIQNYNTTNNLSLTCVEVDDVIYANRNFVAKDSQTTFYLDCNFYGQIYIHDTNFEQELISLNIDDTLDKYISRNDASAVTELILDSKEILDLTGIEGFVNLQKLSVFDNNLTYLDVRRNQELLELNCSNNNLEELDVTFNTKLTDLKCASNNLQEINLKPLSDLISTTIANNVIENLDLSENLKLEFFEAENNNLFCIQVKDVAYAEANWTDNVDENVVFLNDCDVTAISDLALEEELVELGLDDFVDGYISTTSIRNVRVLNVSNKNISDLSIIRLFENLEILICNNNNLNVLDVSNNLNLIELQTSNNELTELITGNNSNLQVIDCSRNRITNLDVSQNSNLKKLNFEVNELTNINTQNNTELEELNCGSNDNLSQLNLTNNTKLLSLTFIYSRIESIDLSNNVLLKTLWIYLNFNMTAIDLSNNVNLERVIIAETQIETLNVTNNTAINFLSIGASYFRTLDLSQNTALETLWLNESDITKLDLKENTLLKELDVTFCENLMNLDLSNNTTLEKLEANNSNLETVDLSNNSSLNYIDLRNNDDLFCIKISDSDFLDQINYKAIDNHTNFNTDCSTIWTVSADPTLQTALDNVPNLDSDNDGNITLAEAAAFQGGLDLANSGITNVEGLQAFTSITILDISGNNITDLSPLTGLGIEIISKTGKTKTVHKKSSAMALEYLYANDTQLTSVNLDALTNLKEVDFSNNAELVTLSLKNGNNSAITYFDSRNTPKLSCIIVDDKDATYLSNFQKDTGNNFVDDEADCRSNVLSTEDAFLQKEINVFPNPVTHFLTIESTKEFDYIEVYNSIGKRIIKTVERKIDFSNYNSGIYFLKIIADNKVLTKKVIKN